MSRQRSEERARYWRGVISEQRASGQTVAAFCRDRDVSPPSFYAWQRRLANCNAPQFVPVSLPTPSLEFEVRLPGGVSVVVPGGFAEAPLVRLLKLVSAELGDA